MICDNCKYRKHYRDVYGIWYDDAEDCPVPCTDGKMETIQKLLSTISYLDFRERDTIKRAIEITKRKGLSK